MPATLATLNAVTKEVYEGRLNEQLNHDVVALRRIERSSEGVTNHVGGRYVVFPIHTRRNTGIGSRQESEMLPAAGQQGTQAAQVNLKYHYGSVQLTGQAISLIDKDFQSFIASMDLELNGLKDDLAKNMNRQVYGTGNGAIATVRTAGSFTVIPVDSAKLFNLGDLVDIVTLPNTVAVTGRTVTNVDLTPGANTVTISGAAVTTTVGQIITRQGSGPVSATVNREITGFGAIVNNTGTLYNIDPTVEPVWKAEVDSNGGTLRAVSEGLFGQMADRIYTNGGKTTLILTSLGVRRAYANLLTQQRQFVNTTKFEGGFSGIAFTTDRGEIPVVTDIDCPNNTAYFLNEKEIKLYRESDWSFMDLDGSKWQRVLNGAGGAGTYDAYGATMYQYSELGTHRRNTHGVIRDLTEG